MVAFEAATRVEADRLHKKAIGAENVFSPKDFGDGMFSGRFRDLDGNLLGIYDWSAP